MQAQADPPNSTMWAILHTDRKDRQSTISRRGFHQPGEKEKLDKTSPIPKSALPRKLNIERRPGQSNSMAGKTETSPAHQLEQPANQRLDVLHNKINRQQHLRQTGAGSGCLQSGIEPNISGSPQGNRLNFISQGSPIPVPSQISLASSSQKWDGKTKGASRTP
jgi:hypothetical protein